MVGSLARSLARSLVASWTAWWVSPSASVAQLVRGRGGARFREQAIRNETFHSPYLSFFRSPSRLVRLFSRMNAISTKEEIKKERKKEIRKEAGIAAVTDVEAVAGDSNSSKQCGWRAQLSSAGSPQRRDGRTNYSNAFGSPFALLIRKQTRLLSHLFAYLSENAFPMS